MEQKSFFSKQAIRFKRFSRKSFSVFNSLHKVITIGVLTGSALVCAHAQSQTPEETSFFQSKSDTISERELDEVVIVSSKTSLPLHLAAKLVTVISSAEVERAPAQSIEDLLNHFSGVDIQQRGPHGVQADIAMRGGTFDQTAILLNGINLTNPQTGHYSFDFPVNLSDIERIEIVQGPTSLLFGAGAFSGGINIITKKEIKNNVSAKFEAGSHTLLGAEARAGIKSKTAMHQISMSHRQSDGYIVNSDYKINNILLQNNLYSNLANIDITLGFNNKRYGANTFYSASYPNQYDKTESFFGAVKGETSGKLKFIPQIYWNRHNDEFQLFREGTPRLPEWYKGHNYHQSDVFGMNLNMQYASTYGITGFGGEMRTESILSNVLGKPLETPVGHFTKADSRTNTSFYIDHNYVCNNFTLSLAGLLNNNTSLPNKYAFYPSVNTTYRANQHWTMYASWNKAFRMPTFTDLYYTTATHSGNIDLKAEKSEAYEVGLKQNHKAVNSYFTFFLMKGDNIIDWIKPSPDALWQSANHSKIIKKGIEAGIDLNVEYIFGNNQPVKQMTLGYMHLNQDMIDSNMISNYSLNHLKNKVTASLQTINYKNASLFITFRWQERAGTYIQYNDLKPAYTAPYKPYSVVDIKSTYNLKKTTLFISINNLFDYRYYDLGNIPQPGRWIVCGFNWQL